MSLKEKIENIMLEVNAIAKDAAPQICLATKTQGIEVLREACGLGFNLFGENRVQELLEKYGKIEGARWHFIGNLQTNKVKYIIDKVELIHSVDRIELALEINKQAKKYGKLMPVLIEVKLADEENKGGVKPEELYPLVDEIIKLDNVRIEGLMAIMPLIKTDFNPYEKMQSIYRNFQRDYPRLCVKYLSMGMSGDYLTAIQHGSNIIRLGRVVFGERDPKA